MFNPSGAPPKPIEMVMAPPVPAAPQSGFFNPGADQQHQPSQQQDVSKQKTVLYKIKILLKKLETILSKLFLTHVET